MLWSFAAPARAALKFRSLNENSPAEISAIATAIRGTLVPLVQRHTDEDEDMNSLEELPPIECWKLLESADLGRLAYLSADRVQIVPVNYLAEAHTIVFASTQGSKLRGIHTVPSVAFEVDGVDGEVNWSVVVHGTATRMNSSREIEASDIRALRGLSPLDKWNYIRIEPVTVTGRRFSRRTSSTIAREAEVVMPPQP